MIWDHELENHPHITSELAVAFIALKMLPELAASEPRWVRPHGGWDRLVYDITQMKDWTGFGHPDCLTCHERYENSCAMGYREARLLLERAEYRLAQKTLASLWRGG
jgi:hypothetical protein